MYIHDVIGQIREAYLMVRQEIDGLRTQVHMLEWQLQQVMTLDEPVYIVRPRGDVSRETEAHDGDPTLF